LLHWTGRPRSLTLGALTFLGSPDFCERPYNPNIWPQFLVAGSISRRQRLGYKKVGGGLARPFDPIFHW
jgi:hypothetical protein